MIQICVWILENETRAFCVQEIAKTTRVADQVMKIFVPEPFRPLFADPE